MNAKTVTVISILAAAGVIGAVVMTRSNSGARTGAVTETIAKGAFLPELGTKANDVAEIRVKRAAQSFTIKNENGAWRLSEKAGYPVNIATVQALVVGLAQLREIEPKTNRPDQHAKLGLDEPAAPPPDSADKPVPQSSLVTLLDDKGATITSVILGNTKQSMSPEMYVRKAGDNQTWLVAGRIDLPTDPVGWLDTSLADIKRDRVKSVTVLHPDGSTIDVSRTNQSDPFRVSNVPEGRELKDAGVAESFGTALASLNFQDVAAASAMDFSKPAETDKPAAKVTLRTFDGLVVQAEALIRDGRTWWKLAANTDPAVVSTLPPAQAASTPTDPGTGNSTTATPTTPPAVTQEGLKAEAEKLNAAWSAYVFAPADWKVRSLNKTMAELLKDPTPPATPATQGQPGASPASP